MTERTILLAHGSGGRYTRDLIKEEILSRFNNNFLQDLPDAASLAAENNNIVFTTDNFVVRPFEFPGGDIGTLAVNGTINDISVCGAVPKWISLALIIEEGFPFSSLRKILDSIKQTAINTGVSIVTGDTKVVEKNSCDNIYINTAGIGIKTKDFILSPARIKEGDNVIVSGNIGDHGMAIIAARNKDIRKGPVSDCASVYPLVKAMGDIAGHIKFMRDPTRGGVSAVLNELVEGKAFDVQLFERDIPIHPRTKAIADIMGFDIMHVACEGRIIAVCDALFASEVLHRWRNIKEGANSAIIGTITRGSGIVKVITLSGGVRIVDLPSGDLLPRIC